MLLNEDFRHVKELLFKKYRYELYLFITFQRQSMQGIKLNEKAVVRD